MKIPIIRKTSDLNDSGELQHCYAEVYIPNVPDAHGDHMDVESVRKMAHQFLAENAAAGIDVQHNNQTTQCNYVESFIARKGDQDFKEGAWVVGIHVPDPLLWQEIKKGTFNGLSIEVMAEAADTPLMMDVPGTVKGMTMASKAAIAEEDHEHEFYVTLSKDGKTMEGRTNFVAGHSHLVKKGASTEPTDGHSHRFSLWDYII